MSHANSNIDITGENLQCLSPGAWLDDEVNLTLLSLLLSMMKLNFWKLIVALCISTVLVQVINLYLELLKERERREHQKFLKCHFFNTFFYKKVRSLMYSFPMSLLAMLVSDMLVPVCCELEIIWMSRNQSYLFSCLRDICSVFTLKIWKCARNFAFFFFSNC